VSAPALTAEPSHKIGHGRERLQVLYRNGREAVAAGLVSAALLIPAHRPFGQLFGPNANGTTIPFGRNSALLGTPQSPVCPNPEPLRWSSRLLCL
jgi:hypothetical protein